MDLREEAKKYPGVTVRSSSIQVAFNYNGIRCRESLKVVPTKTLLKSAFEKLQGIKWDIANGNFDYAKHFPESKKAASLSRFSGKSISIERALRDWYTRNYKRWQPSTRRGYEQIIWTHLIPAFGDLNLTELKSFMVKEWMAEYDCSPKRVNNVIGPLRTMFKEAFCDELIESNPLDRVRNLPLVLPEPEPFNLEEIELILNNLTGPNRNLVQFAFWSGLRTSELLALRWKDIDFDTNRVHIRLALVLGKEKSTKTTNGMRTLELQPRALDALEDQKKYATSHENVFLDPQTSKPWTSDQPIRRKVWIPAMNKSKVKYRNPYQTRHTFASMMLSKGANPMWVAVQMGHKDWGMIRKTYGRWIN